MSYRMRKQMALAWPTQQAIPTSISPFYMMLCVPQPLRPKTAKAFFIGRSTIANEIKAAMRQAGMPGTYGRPLLRGACAGNGGPIQQIQARPKHQAAVW